MNIEAGCLQSCDDAIFQGSVSGQKRQHSHSVSSHDSFSAIIFFTLAIANNGNKDDLVVMTESQKTMKSSSVVMSPQVNQNKPKKCQNYIEPQNQT